jgi:hypothetical protein
MIMTSLETAMPSKPIELPPEVAKAFVRDMRAYFAEKGHKADETAARQLQSLKQHYSGKLQLTDVKEMFHRKKEDHA